MQPISFKRHRFPTMLILHAVWLYARFTLSFRDVEELLAERGVDATNETVRRWFLKFGRLVARNLRQSRPQPSPRWHLDEMVIKIRGRRHWLWRAVDDEGEVLDFLVQSRRNAKAARRLLRKLLKKQGFPPKRITTDRLRSYRTASKRERLSARHDQRLRANNRTENSHQAVRRRERKMQRFKSPGSAQRFLSIQATVQNTFYVQRHLLPSRIFKQFRSAAFDVWRSCVATAWALCLQRWCQGAPLNMSMPLAVPNKENLSNVGHADTRCAPNRRRADGCWPTVAPSSSETACTFEFHIAVTLLAFGADEMHQARSGRLSKRRR